MKTIIAKQKILSVAAATCKLTYRFGSLSAEGKISAQSEAWKTSDRLFDRPLSRFNKKKTTAIFTVQRAFST